MGQPLTCIGQVHADKMRAALTMDMLATDLADYLVRKGVSSATVDSPENPNSLFADPVPRNTSHIGKGGRTCRVEEVSVARTEPGGLQGTERQVHRGCVQRV